MKEQKLVSVPLRVLFSETTGFDYSPMELPLEPFFSDGWRIVSYQLAGEGADQGYCYVVILLEREAK